jgi:uncharacterized protein
MNRMLVSNTGPIIALGGVRHLYLLRRLYSRVIVPEAVDKEIRGGEKSSAGLQDYLTAEWIEVQDQGIIDPLLLSALDLGEASVLKLAIQEKSALLLIDERKARKIARTVYGLDVIGTVRVLIDAKQAGLIPKVREELALSNIKAAMELWIETAEEYGDPVPAPKGRKLVFA